MNKVFNIILGLFLLAGSAQAQTFDPTTQGTLVSVADKVCLPIGTGQATANVTLGTLGSSTVTFEVAGGRPAGSLIAVNGTNVSTGAAGTTTTTAGTYRVDIASLTMVCAVLTSASGAQAVTVYIDASIAPAAGIFPAGSGGGGGGGGGVVTGIVGVQNDAGTPLYIAPLPAGSNIVGQFDIDQTTPGTTNGVQLKAGTALAGKFGIDQTTPGTTNGVQVNAALPAGANIIGKTGIDQTTPGTTNGVVVTTALPAGTNLLGSAKVTDGTNTSAVKAASTAPVATDPALVVTTSPNSGVAQGAASSGVNQTLSGCLTAASVSYSNNTINPCYQDANGNLQVKVTNLLSTGVNVAQVNGSSVTVTGTAGEQKVGVEGLGTAGSASGGVLTVQGSASGTAIPVSTTAQGTVTAGTAAANSLLAGAVYTSTEIAPTTSQGFALQGDANAHLRMTERYATAGQCQASAVSAATQCVGLSGASLKYYVTGIDVSDSVAATWTITSSTTAGNACATSPTTVWGGHYFPANGGGSPNIGTQPISVTANSALCCTPSAGPGTCSIRYYIAP